MFKIMAQMIRDFSNFSYENFSSVSAFFKIVFVFVVYSLITTKNSITKALQLFAIFSASIFYLVHSNLSDTLGFFVFIEFSGIFMYTLLGTCFFNSINHKHIYIMPMGYIFGISSDMYLYWLGEWFADFRLDLQYNVDRNMVAIYNFVFSYNNLLVFLSTAIFLCIILPVFYSAMKIKMRQMHIRRLKILARNAQYVQTTDFFKGKSGTGCGRKKR